MADLAVGLRCHRHYRVDRGQQLVVAHGDEQRGLVHVVHRVEGQAPGHPRRLQVGEGDLAQTDEPAVAHALGILFDLHDIPHLSAVSPEEALERLVAAEAQKPDSELLKAVRERHFGDAPE